MVSGDPACEIDQLNAALADAVRRIDRPNVLIFATNDAVAPLVAEGQELVPDGGHFTPEAHRAIGVALAQQILERSP